MFRRINSLLMYGLFLLVCPGTLLAGMPAPLPTDPADTLQKVLQLEDSALVRLQTISFFLLGLLLCALVVRWLWNILQRDFPALPRLSVGKALAGVLLWGLLFVVVLTMISGARELMTPGAWRKQGFTYRLADEGQQPVLPGPEAVRRGHLERLRTALWHHAATHQGRFPTGSEVAAISSELWEVPESGGLRYIYVKGQSAGHAPGLLVYEPELETDRRLVLQTNGDILALKSAEIEKALKQRKGP